MSATSYADALEKVTMEDLRQYPDKVVAVSLSGEGIVATGESLPELAAAVITQYGSNYAYAVACGPQN